MTTKLILTVALLIAGWFVAGLIEPAANTANTLIQSGALMLASLACICFCKFFWAIWHSTFHIVYKRITTWTRNE